MSDLRTAGVLQSYLGQARLVRHDPGQRELSLRKGAGPSGQCALAVVVRSATLVNDTARLSLESLGRPKDGQDARCRAIPSGIRLAISGFEAADTADQVRTRLDAVLLSPETYLRTPGAAAAYVVSSQPRVLLAVDPYYHDPGGRVRYEGELEFEATVGADGRLQRPQLKTSVAEPHQRAILLALSLWRYEPAGGERPVRSRLVFRIH